LLEEDIQIIHGYSFTSYFDLSRLHELLDYICGQDIEVVLNGEKIDVRDTHYPCYPLALCLRKDRVWPFVMEPADVACLIKTHQKPRTCDYTSEYERFLNELALNHICDDTRMPDAGQRLSGATLELRREVAEWVAWSRLPGDICRIVSGYLLPEDDWFVHRLELAVEPEYEVIVTEYACIRIQPAPEPAARASCQIV